MFRMIHGSFHFTGVAERFLSFTHIHFQSEMFFFLSPLLPAQHHFPAGDKRAHKQNCKSSNLSVLRASDEQQEAELLDISRWNLSSSGRFLSFRLWRLLSF